MDAYDAIEEGTLEEFKEALTENPNFDWKHFFFSVFKNENLTAQEVFGKTEFWFAIIKVTTILIFMAVAI